MSWKTRLQEILAAYPDGGQVEVTEDGRLATLTSATFEGVGEAQRQAKVWAYLLSALSDEDLARLEFVYTQTPDEARERAEVA